MDLMIDSEMTRQQLGDLAVAAVTSKLGQRGYTVERPTWAGRQQMLLARRGTECRKIYVKSLRNADYSFIPQHKIELDENRYVALVVFGNNQMAGIYLIPTVVWKQPGGAFPRYDYDKPHQKSAPEYGIRVSQSTFRELDQYRLPD